MPRPRRAAAAKPEGHYTETSRPGTQKRGAATDTAEAGSSKRRAKKAKSEDTRMKGVDNESEEDPDLPLGLSTRSFTPVELEEDLKISYKDLIPPAPELPKRQKRWSQPANKDPIDQLEKTPKGWNKHEPDLHPEYALFILQLSTTAN